MELVRASTDVGKIGLQEARTASCRIPGATRTWNFILSAIGTTEDFELNSDMILFYIFKYSMSEE